VSPYNPRIRWYFGKPVSFLTKLHLCRQNELWTLSTYFIKDDVTYELNRDFTSVPEEDIRSEVVAQWSAPTVAADKIAF
jgi:hypothetical protein